ncbi:MAG: trypsin-like peptidase domain-containing protein [Caldilineaceae bacterium]
MRPYGLVMILLALLTLASTISAQSNYLQPIPAIYRIKSDRCSFEPVARLQTGFRVEGQPGIITALHGVLDCETVSAVSGDSQKIINDLTIAAVDIERDVALLSSTELDQSPDEALVVSSLATTEILTASLHVIGYPLGLDEQDMDEIESVRDIESLDAVIPDEQETPEFIKRKSPDLGIDVLNLQVQLLPGHSGAPVLDTEGHLVGVVNGGLHHGTVARSWAMPWDNVALRSIDDTDVTKKLTVLRQKDIAAFGSFYTFSASTASEIRVTVTPAPALTEQPSNCAFAFLVLDIESAELIRNATISIFARQRYYGTLDSAGYYLAQLPCTIKGQDIRVIVSAAGYRLYNKQLNLDDAVAEVFLEATTPITPTSSPTTRPSPTVTVMPTSTPAALPAATFTTTPIPPVVANSLPTVPAPTARPTNPPATGLITLVSPAEGASLSQESATFQWTWSGPGLDENHAFELWIGHKGLTELPGAADAKDSPRKPNAENNGYTITIQTLSNTAGVNGNGEYEWTVAVVELSPTYTRTSIVADRRSLLIMSGSNPDPSNKTESPSPTATTDIGDLP